jgi:hypothetical protein
MFLLIWGNSGCGKTTLAATAPGEKAYIQFDPQGVASLANRTDYHYMDLSGTTANTALVQFDNADPFGMYAFIKSHPAIETVVVDSLTALSDTALAFAVTRAGGKSNIYVPGRQGYGTRNNVMRRIVSVFMQMCVALNKHLVVITHEGTPEQDGDDGPVTAITMALSNTLANSVSLRFNEVWYMRDAAMERTLYVRPWGVYRPMKSRMFDVRSASSFPWHYDAVTMEGEGIAHWFNQWQSNDGQKIALPVKGVVKK